MRSKYIVLIIIAIAATFCSCRSIRPYEMLRNSKDYEISEQEPSEIEYRIQPNDKLNIRVLNNNGQAYFGMGGTTGGGAANSSGGGFPVEFDGKVKLPVLGRIDISGKTIREAEDTLELLYSEYFQEPFVLLNVNNRKVTVFMNGGSRVQTVAMTNNQFTLIDAIAACGGLTEISRAYRIKLIRGNLTDKPKIYYWNVSSLETLDGTNIMLEANDIIYVESRPQYVTRVLREISPYLTLVTTLMSVYGVIVTVKGYFAKD
ncbi:MAG: polysaccharide biosynthesis/export family protein [Bacteroidales bacterium]|nr:polysaccharide biosynthesis/export family protein [Bacteroidales bacterium]